MQSAQDNSLQTTFDHFISHWYLEQSKKNPAALAIEYDDQWLSDCYLRNNNSNASLAEGDACQWQPVKQTSQDMFSRLSDALEVEIHPDLITFYTLYWSNHIAATSPDGKLELLQVWNQDDMERLRSNLLAHAMDKRKRKQPLSFFFAVTSPDDGMLCLDNLSGEIWYELPGKKPVRKIADSLSEFISSLEPDLETP